MAAIRRDLGLSADSSVDRSLHQRSLTPLTRQKIREILDNNAVAINNTLGANTILTTTQLNRGKAAKDIQDSIDIRNDVNASLAGTRATKENADMASLEAIVAGDVDFRSYNDAQRILEHVRSQLKAILDKTKGAPSAERTAVVELQLPDCGQKVSITTGMTEAAFVRRLEEMVFRLSSLNGTDNRSIAVRDEFAALADVNARLEWLNGLAGSPDAGFKARTAAVRMLADAGITDWDTLSIVNRISDTTARAFAIQLASLDGTKRGDELRNSDFMRAFVNLASNDGVAVPQASCAYIPATSTAAWNNGIRDTFYMNKPENLPHDIRALIDTLPALLSERFGSTIEGSSEPGLLIAGRLNVNELIPNGLLERVTATNLRDRMNTLAVRYGAEQFLFDRLDMMIVEAGGRDKRAADIRNDWFRTRPQLLERFMSVRNLDEATAVFEEFRDVMAADAKRYVAVQRSCERAIGYYKDALARRLGMPVACLDTGLDLGMLSIHAGNLADKIRHGEIVVQTAEEVGNAFREFAEQAANARADEIEVVEKMRADNSPAELCDYLKQMIFDVQRLDLIDISKTVDAARKSTLSGTMETLDAALVPGANKIDIYNAMKSFSEQLREVINGLYPPGAEIGGEEIGLQGNAIMATVLFERPGLAGKLADFFSREDVKSDNLYGENSPAYHAYSFKYFLEHAHSLPDPEFKSKIVASLGTIQMPPFHAQALMEAFKAAGLGDLSVAEKMAMLRPSHQVGLRSPTLSAQTTVPSRRTSLGRSPSRSSRRSPRAFLHCGAKPTPSAWKPCSQSTAVASPPPTRRGSASSRKRSTSPRRRPLRAKSRSPGGWTKYAAAAVSQTRPPPPPAGRSPQAPRPRTCGSTSAARACS